MNFEKKEGSGVEIEVKMEEQFSWSEKPITLFSLDLERAHNFDFIKCEPATVFCGLLFV